MYGHITYGDLLPLLFDSSATAATASTSTYQSSARNGTKTQTASAHSTAVGSRGTASNTRTLGGATAARKAVGDKHPQKEFESSAGGANSALRTSTHPGKQKS